MAKHLRLRKMKVNTVENERGSKVEKNEWTTSENIEEAVWTFKVDRTNE